MWLRQVQGTLAALAATAAAAATLVAAAAPASAVVVEPFAQRYDEAVYGDFVTLGNTVMECPSTPADDAARCLAAQAGTTSENNNQFDMQYTNTSGFSAGVLNSSTGQVTIPPGATVAYARLFWGGNDGTYKLGNNQIARCDTAGLATSPTDSGPLDTRPRVRVGGGPESQVTVENAVRTPAAVGGPHYYTAESDITSLFASAPTGSPVPVAVGDIWAPTGKGCVGGWSLTVVYKYDGPNEQYAPTRRHVYVYGGHVVQQSKDPDTTIGIDGFYRAGNKDVRASVTAYEGDANVSGDAFLVNGTRISDPDSGAGTNNFFNSRAEGCLDPCEGNNFSIDAKTATIPSDVIPEGATSANLTFRTRGDTYVPSALAFSVPVPDLEVKKSASPKTVKPGDKVTYTITAKNIGGVDYPGASLSDDLSELLDDATYDNDAKATIGRVSYDRPRLSWSGTVPEGETATLTYSVTLHDPLSGDGKLTNNVTADTPRTNCEADSTDPSCGFTPVIEKPTPPPVTPTPALEIVNRPQRPTAPPCATVRDTITIGNKSGDPRKRAAVSFPAKHIKGTPVVSSGTLTKKGADYVWTGDVPAHGKVVITANLRVSCTPGAVTVLPVTGEVPKTNCTARTRGGDDPCTAVVVTERRQARPTPPHPQPHGPELAATGSDVPVLLYGGLALSLCGAGALVLSAVSRRKD
ncbi:hypothetical protein ABZ930_38110 [Streptomyces sp. NPDC046716]|uniref:DUF7927 domain-containing protein n=1 Tax=Streptomyces sp. NPDC046716 TaxID=3157093 RepID=UPI0033D413B8